jgi:hypothetical protein
VSGGSVLKEVAPSLTFPHEPTNKKKDKKMLRILPPTPQREVSSQLRETTVSLLTDLYVCTHTHSLSLSTLASVCLSQCILLCLV